MANFYNLEAGEGTSELARVYFEKIKKSEDVHLGPYKSSLRHLLVTDEPSTFLFMKEIMPFLGEDLCKTAIAYEFNFPAKVSLAFPKKSPYHEIFNYGLLKMMESGFLESALKKHLENPNNCYNGGGSDKEKTNGNSLGFVKLSSLFVIMGAGIVLSAITLILEAINATINKISANDGESLNEATKVQTISEGPSAGGDLNVLMMKWGISDVHSFRTDLKQLLQRNPEFFISK